MSKKVSVIIPTYKRPVTLERTIKSVLNSSYKNVEIIVVDDNNDGDTFRNETEIVMKSLLEENDNIIYIKHEYNKNGSAARNTGINKSTGEYIMFLDDDDEFLKNKIEGQVNYMQEHDDSWGACYTKYFDKRNGKLICTCGETKEGNLLAEELARNLFIHAGSNLMVRREVLDKVGGFDETFRRNQDVEFLVRVLEKYKLGYVDIDGLIVNVHKKNYGIDYFDLTDKYIEKFRPVIDSQQENIKEGIYKMLGLQQIRHALENKNIAKVKKLMNTYHINKISIMKYLIHLTYRVISKKAYGYDMNKLI